MPKRVKTLEGRKQKDEPVEDSESDYSEIEASDASLASDSELEVEVGDEDDDEDEDDSMSEAASSSDEEQEEDDKFAESMSKILASKVKVKDRENPIMIRNNLKAKEIEESKLNAKAKAALRAEKLQNKDRARVKDIIPKDPEAAGDALSREKALKKIAQRGIVRLFNAVNQAQRVEADGADAKQQDKVTALSKDKFLDVIRGG